MTKSQYYKWRSKLRQVYRRQNFEDDCCNDSELEVAKRLFKKASEKEIKDLVKSLDKHRYLPGIEELHMRLREYKWKNKKESPIDILTRKIEEAERDLLIKLNKQLYGG